MMMVAPPGLPQIVDTKTTLARDIQKIDRVQVEELKQLWKIYTTNKNVIETGRRLENLCWRIWGSDRIFRNISGRTVAAIFVFIMEGEEAVKDPALRIRPLKRRSIPKRTQSIIECPPTPPPSPARVNGGPMSTEGLEFQLSQTALSASLLQAYPDSPPSPPSLPKVPPPSPATPLRPPLSRNHQSYPQTALKQQLDAAFGNRRPMQRKVGNLKKRTQFASNTKPDAPTTKESINSFKGSQSPLSKSYSVSSISGKGSSNGASQETSSSNSPSNSQNEVPNNHAEVTHQSVPPIKATKGNPSGGNNASAKSDSALRRVRKGDNSRNNQAWVVDPDFRLRFQERRKKEEAGYRLKTAATTATVATTALSVSENRTGKNKGRGRNVYVVDDVAPLKFTGPVPELFTDEAIRTEGVPVVTGPNRLMEKESEKTAAPLVRTKSQLTLLIEDARRSDEPSQIVNSAVPQNGSPLKHESSSPSRGDSEDGNQEDDGFEDVDEGEAGDGSPEIKKKNSTKVKAKRRHRPRVKR